MSAIGRAFIVCVPMCVIRVLLEFLSTKSTYGMLVPMNTSTFVVNFPEFQIICNDGEDLVNKFS